MNMFSPQQKQTSRLPLDLTTTWQKRWLILWNMSTLIFHLASQELHGNVWVCP